MNVLLDSNILCRTVQPGHVQYQPAEDGVATLRLRGDTLCLVPQVLYEFWAVATRPASANGLGFPIAVVAQELNRLKAVFPLLSDNSLIFSEWERLVLSRQIGGKDSHDARLVAAMAVHGITTILTFDALDFAGFPGVTVIDPIAITSPPPK